MCRGGAEQVTLSFHRAFPKAPLFTLCYQPHLTYPEFQACDIHTSWLQPVAKTDAIMKRLYFPFGIWAMSQLDLTRFDVVLISSTHCGKYIKVSDTALVINYCHTPFRLIWEPESYAQYLNAGAVRRKCFDIVINYLRKVDLKAAQRSDYYIANTKETAERIHKTYSPSQPVSVINPPVNVHNFVVSEVPKTYFLLVSRLEYYKKVDLVIEAFNQLGYPLIIVGKGVQGDTLRTMAKPNITFMSGLSAQELAAVYAGCRAFLVPQHEDYGITPLEANASGRPVIAYRAGGVLTTQLPATANASRATALFFNEQTVPAQVEAVKQFEQIEDQFDSGFIRRHAEAFDEQPFIEQIKQFVLNKYAAVSQPTAA